MLKGEAGGSRIASGGMAGRPSQSNCPKRASHSLVKTRAVPAPPCARTNSRARAISARSGSTPATFRAKYASVVTLTSPGPPQ